jgi:hypothetical protein
MSYTLDEDAPMWGVGYDAAGYIATPDESTWRHFIGGGSGWAVEDATGLPTAPTVLLTLDLRDPALQGIGVVGCDALVLASHLNSNVSDGLQVYSLDPCHKAIRLISRETHQVELLEPEGSMTTPLLERPLRLRSMVDADLPVTEAGYTGAVAGFLGGHAFIRVLGAPLWLYAPEIHECTKGHSMRYIAAIGHEPFDEDIEVFFAGEMAFYFHLCDRCLEVHVTTQPT